MSLHLLCTFLHQPGAGGGGCYILLGQHGHSLLHLQADLGLHTFGLLGQQVKHVIHAPHWIACLQTPIPRAYFFHIVQLSITFQQVYIPAEPL